jgi:hypothetical protein
MTTENDENQPDDDQAETFGKGLRVRIAEGEDAGARGEIVWWGRSKYGPEMRAGVQTEEDEKIWVDATQLRAIDDQGDDLDPQPAIEPPPALTTTTTAIRAIELRGDLARAITAVRIDRGYPESKAPTAKVRLDRLEQAEDAMGCTIPDPIIAYVVSGLGSIREVGGIVGLTGDLYDRLGDDTPVIDAERLAFDCDNADFLSFRRGDDRATDVAGLHPHEEGLAQPVSIALVDWLSDQLDEDVSPRTPPFEVAVDYITRDEPEPEPDEPHVTHAKFGHGVVVSSESTRRGDKLTIRFDDGEVRKLLDRFVTFDDADA